MCPNGHDVDQIEVKDNGARVCRACASTYNARIRQHNKAHKLSKIRQEGATNHVRSIQ